MCVGWFQGERQRLALSLFSDHPGLSRWEINKRLGPSQGMQTTALLRKSDREEVYDGQKEMVNLIYLQVVINGRTKQNTESTCMQHQAASLEIVIII